MAKGKDFLKKDQTLTTIAIIILLFAAMIDWNIKSWLLLLVIILLLATWYYKK